jgi:hypothetical protein
MYTTFTSGQPGFYLLPSKNTGKNEGFHLFKKMKPFEYFLSNHAIGKSGGNRGIDYKSVYKQV